MLTVLVAFTIREDYAGVTSFVRCLGLREKFYHLLLNFFHSYSLCINTLQRLWFKLCLSIFSDKIETVNGRIITILDGLKIAKEGKKMPAVKSLHQESENNSKPPFIMGHYVECISLLVRGLGQFFAVPIAGNIHGGVIFNQEDKEITLIDRAIEMVYNVIDSPFYMVGDAYYAAKKVMIALRGKDNHIISRMRKNSTAYKELEKKKSTKKRRGRHKKYGEKIWLKNYFKNKNFVEGKSPVYGEENVSIKFLMLNNLLLRPFQIEVCIVLVKHPKRGKIILISTDRTLSALEIIKIYGLRFKIEVSFKQAISTLGAYTYHFWMLLMQKIKKTSGDQDVSKKDQKYRNQVKRKLHAYHSYVQTGLIAQGLLIALAVNQKNLVWKSFYTWFRTMNPEKNPSELIVKYAMCSTFWPFLRALPATHLWKKFIRPKIDFAKKFPFAKAS